MILKDKHSSFEIRITGYEFPDSVNEDDSRWVNVWLRIIQNNKTLVDENIGAALYDSDAYEIDLWLEDIAMGQPKAKSSISVKYPTLGFMEPDLEFEFLGYENDFAKIRIIYYNSESGLSTNLKIPKKVLLKMLKGWKEEIGGYPSKPEIS